MEIDWRAVYDAADMQLGGLPLWADRALREYHRQLEEELYHSYVHRAIQGTEPITPPTCDCEGREKLEKVGWLQREHDGRWYHILPWRDDRTKRSNLMLRETCPLCDKPLP